MAANADAQQAGFVAGAKGAGWYVNPHSRGEGAHRAWLRGWRDGNSVYILNTPSHLIRSSALRKEQSLAASIDERWAQEYDEDKAHRTCDGHGDGLANVIALGFALVLILPFLGWLASLVW